MKPAHLSDFDKIRLDKLRDSIREDSNAKQLIRIPKYQRGIVWKESQKKALLESIFKGYPIGMLLCHDTRESVGAPTDKRAVWELVDGLQRTSTLTEFMERPLALLPIEQAVSVRLIQTICENLGLDPNEDNQKAIANAISTWSAEIGEAKSSKGFTSENLRKYFSAKFPEAIFTPELNSSLDQVTDEISEAIGEILTREIPITIYSGSAADVPTIFKLVNTMGTQLTKYQVFAATWSRYQTLISNPDIRAKISEKYKSYLDRGFEVQGYEEGDSIEIDGYNLYEYLYGLGQHLASAKGFGRLFPDPTNDPDDAAAVAFNMATVAFGLRIGEMDKLAAHLAGLQSENQPIDLRKFEVALVDACAKVWKKLTPFVGLKLNAVDGEGRVTAHSLNQIISLILRYLVSAYDPLTWEKTSGVQSEKILANIPSFYLFDIIAANWRSAGEKRLWDMVWSVETDAQQSKLIPSSDYIQPVNEERWIATLNVWFDDQLSKKQVSRQNITEATRAFLRFIYTTRIPFHTDAAESFHIEHIYPVKKLGDAIKKTTSGEGWPISHIGNLCILPQEINEKKGDMMLGDYIAIQETPLTNEKLAQLDSYVITELAKDLQWADDFERDQYLGFCRRRFAVQVEELLKTLSPPKF